MVIGAGEAVRGIGVPAGDEADRVAVAIEGEGAGRLDTGTGNVVVRAARMAYEAAGRRFPGATLIVTVATLLSSWPSLAL